MSERGILFSAQMVRALLNGSKTQTRRALRKQFAADAEVAEVAATTYEGWQISGHSGLWWDDAGGCFDDAVRCPYGMPGDALWTREAWRTVQEADATPPRDLDAAYRLWYEADAPHQPGFGRLRPGMFMPRWASRITLEVTGVRVERLQEISRDDAIAEGVTWHRSSGVEPPEGMPRDPIGAYRQLWNQINGSNSWDANPWVWAVGFRRLRPRP